MAASKARHIEKVWRAESRGPVFASVLGADDIYVVEQIADLPRVEQIKVATLVGATRPASATNWLSCNESQILAAIDAAVNGETHYAADPARGIPAQTTEIDAAPRSIVRNDDMPTAVDRFAERDATARANNNRAAIDTADAAKLAELIGKLAGGSVDAAQVANIVDDRLIDALADLETRLSEQLRRPQITRIEYVDRPAVELPGRQHKCFADVLAVIQRRHVHKRSLMLVGPAATGKTTIGHSVADALALPFYSIGAEAEAHSLLGYRDVNGNYVRTLFREAYEFGGVFLFDEIDSAIPEAMLVLNQALANGSAPFPDGMVARHPNFIAVAAANTWGTGPTAEYVGRNRLDAAFLDRFATMFVDVDLELEEDLVYGASNVSRDITDAWLTKYRAMRSAADAHKIHVVLSTRGAVFGASMLDLWPSDRLVADLLAPLPEDARRKILAASTDSAV